MKGTTLVKTFFTFCKLLLVVAVIVLGVNVFVVRSTDDRIVLSYDGSEDDLKENSIEQLKTIEPDCILVLGASVNPDGTPSRMLQDRLDTAIALYKAKAAPKLLLSGDNGQMEYNETAVMRDYAIEAGVPEEDIFLDHAGFSTYESVYRAGYIFQVESMIVVTQEYHLYRALYGCGRMGIEALGAAAAQNVYTGQEMRDIREILARDKDFVKWIIKPKPTFLGDEIPISGSGVPTH